MAGPMTFNIEIGEEDVARAKRGSPSHCVVAEAIRRVIPDAKNISVDWRTVRFTRADGFRYVYPSPAMVEFYTIAYDMGRMIPPFRFRLQRGQRVRRQIRTERGLEIKRSGTSEKEGPLTQSDGAGPKPPHRVQGIRGRHFGARALRVSQDFDRLEDIPFLKFVENP